MKKVLLILSFMIVMLALASCGHIHLPGEKLAIEQEPTCTKDGLGYIYCLECGEVAKIVVIPATGIHKVETIPAKEATCTEKGSTEGERCSWCGEILVEQQIIPIEDHIESDWIIDKEATKAEDGYKHIECTMCGKILAEEILDATGSVGLGYELNSDGTNYSVVGIGTCVDTDIVIPKIYNELPVTSIGARAFDNCTSLESVKIGNSVTNIDNYAFSDCISLSSIEIPDSVTSIGGAAFLRCTSLKNIKIGNSVTNIDNYTFWGCSSLTSIEIPDSVTSIGGAAFANCISLISIEIPDSVTSIGMDAFNSCKSLKNVKMGNSVKSIGDWAFAFCTSLTNIEIPNSVTSIGEGMFCQCESLESVTIGDSVTSIGDYAFTSCKSLKNVKMGNSVKSIGDWAFCDCILLANITFEGTFEQWNAISFGYNWNDNFPATEVVCSNGTVSLK